MSPVRNATPHRTMARVPRVPHSGAMGTIIRLLVTKVLPARLTWIVAAFVFARVAVGRRDTRLARRPGVV